MTTAILLALSAVCGQHAQDNWWDLPEPEPMIWGQVVHREGPAIWGKPVPAIKVVKTVKAAPKPVVTQPIASPVRMVKVCSNGVCRYVPVSQPVTSQQPVQMVKVCSNGVCRYVPASQVQSQVQSTSRPVVQPRFRLFRRR